MTKIKFKEAYPLDDFISDKELSNTTIQKKVTIEQQKQVNTISKQINLDNEGLLAFVSDLQLKL